MKINTRTRRTALNLFMLAALLAATLGMPTNALAVQPANDAIFAAVAITSLPATLTMSDDDFNDAINGAGDPNVCGFGNPGVHTIWYSLIPTSYGKATIDTFGSSFDTIVAVWTYNNGVFQSIACNDDSTTGVQSEIKNLQLLAGTKYYIEVVQYTSGAAPVKEQDRPVTPSLVSNYMTLNVSFSQDLNIGEPGIKYDDKHSIFAYSGNWLNANSVKAYSGSFKLSKVVGNSATVSFAGTQFKVYYTKYIQYGNLELYLDGSLTPLDTINQVGSTAYAFQQVYVSPVFADGIHTLQLKHGTKYVTIDAIEFIGAPDLIPPAAITDLAAAPGAAYGSVDLSWTASGDDGIDGIAKYYEVRYSTSPINSEGTWSAATPVTSGVPTPKPSGQAETMTVTGLGLNLTYYFAVKVFDEPAPDSTGSGLSNSASAATVGPPPSGPGAYDDKLDADKWLYTGPWTQINAPSAYMQAYRWSNMIGISSAAFVFTGDKFTLLYIANSSGGVVAVRVDGVSVGTINMKSSFTKYNQKFVYSVSPGDHTVQFILMSGNRIYVDGILIESSGPIEPPDLIPPAAITDLAAAPGAAYGSVDLSWTASGDDGTVGTASSYDVRYSTSPINSEGAWSAATPVTSGVPTPKPSGQPEAMTVSGLAPNMTYYFAIRVLDEAAPDPTPSGLSNLVSAFVSGPPPSGPGAYDDKLDADKWIYVGAWTQTNTIKAYQNSFSWASAGSSASFAFTGATKFTLLYLANSAGGVVDVRVDGVSVGTINMKSSFPKYNQKFVYSVSPGDHTVQFVLLSGNRIYVDGILIE